MVSDDPPQVQIDRASARDGSTAVQVNVGASASASKPLSNLPDWGEKPFVGRDAALADLERRLQTEGKHLVVVHGRSGVGKSGLVRRFAAANAHRYDAVIEFRAGDFTKTARSIAEAGQLLLPPAAVPLTNTSVESQAAAVLRYLAGFRCLLIYDDLHSGQSLGHPADTLLPPVGHHCDILATSVNGLDRRFHRLRLEPLPEEDGAQLLAAYAEDGPLTEAERRVVAKRLGGLPAALQPVAASLDGAWRRQDLEVLVAHGRRGAEAGYRRIWERLGEVERVVLYSASLFDARAVPSDQVCQLADRTVTGVDEALDRVDEALDRVAEALDRCVRNMLLDAIVPATARDTDEPILQMHGLLRRFVQSTIDPDTGRRALRAASTLLLEDAQSLVECPGDWARIQRFGRWDAGGPAWPRLSDENWKSDSPAVVLEALVEVGRFDEAKALLPPTRAAGERPVHQADGPLVSRYWLNVAGLLHFEVGEFEAARSSFQHALETAPARTSRRSDRCDGWVALLGVGDCLSERGEFAEAQGWYERAVAAAEQGDRHGRVDPESLGTSLHQVGYCLSERGEFAAAQGWYGRAVAAKQQGDRHGRVDPESLGTSLHQVGWCLSERGEFAEAQGWYERAAAAKEQGDRHGRVDRQSLGRSLHQVGWCLIERGEFAEAQGWYERAVAAAEQGDRHGRVDPESLGSSLDQVGWCLGERGEFAEAQGWYERAVAAKHQGDRHGRVDPRSLGGSLHQVGWCLHKRGEFAEAQGWYERAVAVLEQGDRHGRVDPESLGGSLHQVGHCLSARGEFVEAQRWSERALAAKEQGDRHGRVDLQSLGSSLHQAGHCLSARGKFAEAQGWYERAVAAQQQGDRHGRVDQQSLGRSLHQVGWCLSARGEFAEAQGWYERAVAAQQQGDRSGRVDSDSLGRSLHQVGWCLSERGEFAEAQGWYERAVAAAEQGDRHGRVDPQSLGRSFHQVGWCLSERGEFAEAQGWYERAVAAAEQEDRHGRVDPQSLRVSLRALLSASARAGDHARARETERRLRSLRA